MPEVKFACPNCQQTLEAPFEMAGQVCECPTCQQQIIIPAAEAAPTPESSSALPTSDELTNSMTEAIAAADKQAAGSPSEPPASAATCTECGAEMAPDAVLCVQCGFHKELGKKIGTDLA